MTTRSINAEEATQMHNHFMLGIDDIVVDTRNNNRFGQYTEEDIQDLLQDLDDGIGIHTAVICRPDSDRRPILVQGYRRYTALRTWNERNPPSKVQKLPVIIRDMNPQEALQSNIIENVHRKELSPMDFAVGIRNLSNAGCTDEQIKRVYKRSVAWVIQMRKLLQLDRDLQKRIHKGEIAASAGIELADVTGDVRGVLVQTIDNSYGKKFTTTNIRKAGRDIGAFGDGVSTGSFVVRPIPTEDGVPVVTGGRPHTPKRKQRTVCEQNDFWDRWEMDDRLSPAGKQFVKLHQGFISGRVMESDMDQFMLQTYGSGSGSGTGPA